VLIIDDNQDDVEILQWHLNHCYTYDIKSENAVDVHHLWGKLSDSRFDIIFLDNRLGGGVTARNVLMDFHEKNIDIPVVVITGQADEQTAVELMKAGACDYVTKDSLIPQLLEKIISSTIERHKLTIRQKQNQKKLQESEQRYHRLTNAVTDYIFTVRFENGQPAETIHSDTSVAVTGYTPQDFAAEPHLWINMVHRKDRPLVYEQVSRCISGRAIEPLEHRIVRKDGVVRWVKSTLVRHFDSQGNLLSYDGLLQDITDRKRGEQIQMHLFAELEKTNQELRDFAYIISHDLKAPLRAIKTLAEWITSDYADKLGKEGKEQMSLLLHRADRMQNLIDGVLQYSRTGHTEEKHVQINLNELVLEVINTIAPPENINVTIENELPVIRCGETHLVQVFQNLLSNAVKYINKPQGRVKIGCVEEDTFWRFSVADNGVGIEEKHFDTIFQIFQTLSPRDEFESTGVGLTVTKKIVELYNGKIWVESKPGQGSTFFFTLPKQAAGVKDAEPETITVSGR